MHVLSPPIANLLDIRANLCYRGAKRRRSVEAQEQLGRLQAELDYLEQIERALEEQQTRVRQCTRNTWEERDNLKYAYVTRTQLLSVLPSCTLLAIQSPPGTQFEVIKPNSDGDQLATTETKPEVSFESEKHSASSNDVEQPAETRSRALVGGNRRWMDEPQEDGDSLPVYQLNLRGSNGAITALLVNHGDESSWFLSSPPHHPCPLDYLLGESVQSSQGASNANAGPSYAASSAPSDEIDNVPSTSQGETVTTNEGPPSRRTRYNAMRSPVTAGSLRKASARTAESGSRENETKPEIPPENVAGNQPSANDSPSSYCATLSSTDRLKKSNSSSQLGTTANNAQLTPNSAAFYADDSWNALGVPMPTATTSLLSAFSSNTGNSPRLASLSRTLTPSKSVLSASAFNDFYGDLMSSNLLSPILRISPPSSEQEWQCSLGSMPDAQESLFDMFELHFDRPIVSRPENILQVNAVTGSSNVERTRPTSVLTSLPVLRGPTPVRKWTAPAAPARLPTTADVQVHQPVAATNEVQTSDTAS